MKHDRIKVKNNDGQYKTWRIEEEKRHTYKIFSNGIITEVYKSNCFVHNEILYSNEIRDNYYPNYKSWYDYQTETDRDIDHGYWEADDSIRDTDLEYEGWDSEGQQEMHEYIKGRVDR